MGSLRKDTFGDHFEKNDFEISTDSSPINQT